MSPKKKKKEEENQEQEKKAKKEKRRRSFENDPASVLQEFTSVGDLNVSKHHRRRRRKDEEETNKQQNKEEKEKGREQSVNLIQGPPKGFLGLFGHSRHYHADL